MLPLFPHEKLLVPSLEEFVGKGPDSQGVVCGSEQLLHGRPPHLGYGLGRSDVDLCCVSWLRLSLGTRPLSERDGDINGRVAWKKGEKTVPLPSRLSRQRGCFSLRGLPTREA